MFTIIYPLTDCLVYEFSYIAPLVMMATELNVSNIQPFMKERSSDLPYVQFGLN